MFEKVLFQFPPYKYGAISDDLKNEKYNIVVVSIEGLLSACNYTNYGDERILLNIINDDILDVQRENRNPQFEENFSKGVLEYFSVGNLSDENILIMNDDKTVYYKEIKLSELKKVRDNPDELIRYIETAIEN